MTATPAPDAQAGTVEVLAAHEPVPGRFGNLTGIVGCSCLSARDYAAAGFRAGQKGWRLHVATALAAAGLTTEADQPRDGLRAAVEALTDEWSKALDDGCPSCGPVGFTGCDHIEGYHHAWSDLRALLADQPPTPDEGDARE